LTFSIAARCPRTGQLGVATSSASLACGAFAPSVQTSIGAIASQALANPFYGGDGLRLLANGVPPDRVVAELMAADPGRELRQLLVVDARGGTAVFTGTECISWAGHQIGAGFIAGGNTLVGEQVVTAMAAAFEETEAEELADRLVRALEAGEAAGGDRRGRQSAALLVAYDQDYRYFDLRVDHHQEPIAELRRIFEMRREAQARWGSFRPTRDAPLPPGFLDTWPQIKATHELEVTGKATQA
jgi:uncharacterized Ntn-hydrolase superfamily protein